jgi:hypothetical protein
MRRFRHGYDLKKDLNYLSVYINIPTTVDNKPIIDAFSIFVELLVKAYKLESYNRKSKYDKY